MTSTRTTRWASAATLAAASPLLLATLASPASAGTAVDRPSTFTHAYSTNATPDQVIGPDNTTPAPGEPGTSGTFQFLINLDDEIICWDITTNGVTPPYQSAAKTATHIHETAAGTNGPPRLAFPDPTPEDPTATVRNSTGCFQGPFTTGLAPSGTDTGEGFTLAQIVANPAGFSADTHTSTFVPGAVRGQLAFDQALLDAANTPAVTPTAPGQAPAQVPAGGVRTGEGASTSTVPLGLMAAAAASVGLTGAAVAMRRRQSA